MKGKTWMWIGWLLIILGFLGLLAIYNVFGLPLLNGGAILLGSYLVFKRRGGGG